MRHNRKLRGENMSERDFAQEFKDSFENQDFENVLSIMSEWVEEDLDDANLGLAMVIVGSLNDNIEFTKTFGLYKQAIQDKPVNESLFDWFNGTAINIMEKRVDDDIGFSEMFNNKYKSKRPSNNYAVEFLNLFEDIVENDQIDALDELRDIVGQWQENYPDDANMHCAYVILKINDINADELAERVKTANDLTPTDKNSYPKLLTLMNEVCKAKDKI